MPLLVPLQCNGQGILHNSLLAIDRGIAQETLNMALKDIPYHVRTSMAFVEAEFAGNTYGLDTSLPISMVDESLMKDLRENHGTTQYYGMMKEYCEQIERLFGTKDANNTLVHGANEVIKALEAIETNPCEENKSLFVMIFQNHLADIRRVQNGLIEIRQKVDRTINIQAEEVNTFLEQIATLNQQISKQPPEQKQSLINQRRQILHDLNARIGIEVVFELDQQVTVVTNNGVALVHGNKFSPLSYTSQTVADLDTPFNPLIVSSLMIEKLPVPNSPDRPTLNLLPSENSPLTPLNPTNYPITVGVDITSNLLNSWQSGTLKALVDLRDDWLVGMMEQMNQYANHLATQLNSVQTPNGPAHLLGGLDLGGIHYAQNIQFNSTTIGRNAERICQERDTRPIHHLIESLKTNIYSFPPTTTRSIRRTTTIDFLTSLVSVQVENKRNQEELYNQNQARYDVLTRAVSDIGKVDPEKTMERIYELSQSRKYLIDTMQVYRHMEKELSELLH
jgi:flagellar hook-associated protein FlgK